MANSSALTIAYSFELTDTYGGEANYSWCRRITVALPENTDSKMLTRLAKQWAGLSGERCKVKDYGDGELVIIPFNLCQILFVHSFPE